jgi:hypothetical protein
MNSAFEGDFALYGAVGFDRRRGSGGVIGMRGTGRHARVVRTSETFTFEVPDGASLTVTSQSPMNDEHFEQFRGWAPMNTYLSTPAGRQAMADWDRKGPPPRPVEIDWRPTTIEVEGIDTSFEVCDLDDGFWVAVGLLVDATVTVGAHQVPQEAVRLERLAGRGLPLLPFPDIGDPTERIEQDLDRRFTRMPFGRVHGLSDYWALHRVEIDHVDRISTKHGLSQVHHRALHDYWLRRIETELEPTLERLHFRDMQTMHKSRIARHLGHGVAFQVWMNTLGPGARTWFQNRYVGVRRYTFRIRWRP